MPDFSVNADFSVRGGNQTVTKLDFVAAGADCPTASSSSRQRAFVVYRGRHCWRSIKRRATENETATIFDLPETGKAACRTDAVAKAVLPKGRSARRGRSAGYTETYIHTAPPSHCRQPLARDYLQVIAYQEESTEDICLQILPNIEIQNTEKDGPTRRTPKKDSRSPQKASLSMDSRRTSRKIPVPKSRSRTPRVDSRTPAPRTSRSRTPRASRLPTPRASRSPTPRAFRSPTPRASRSPTPRASASASSFKVQPPQEIKKDLYTTPKMPSRISFSRNLRHYAVDWESFEVDAFPITWKPYAYRPGLEFLVAYCWNTTQPGTEALSLHWKLCAGTIICAQRTYQCEIHHCLQKRRGYSFGATPLT